MLNRARVALMLAPLATLATLAPPAIAQDAALRGVVYTDANANGQRDAGERGIPNVTVSNQDALVVTDSLGRFEIPRGPTGIVFVSLPDGFRSSGAFWRAATATSFDFGLVRQQQPRTFTFIHASDPHIAQENVARVRRFMAIADSVNPAFTLITGDLIRDAASQQEPRARGYFELYLAEMKLRAPIWTVPGNHDHFGIVKTRSRVPETHPLYDRGMYRHYFGPDYYSFTWGGVHFVGLNTIQPDDSAYYGGIDSLQLAWLARDIAAIPASMPVVTFNHIPLTSGVEALTGYIEMPMVSSIAHLKTGPSFRHTGANTLAVLDVFKGRPLPLLLGGHTHVAEKMVYQTDRGPLRFEQSAAIVGPNDYGPVTMASGFSVYTVTNGAIDAGRFVRLDPLPANR